MGRPSASGGLWKLWVGGFQWLIIRGVHRLGEAQATKVSDSSRGNLLMGHRTRDEQVQHGIIDKGPKKDNNEPVSLASRN